MGIFFISHVIGWTLLVYLNYLKTKYFIYYEKFSVPEYDISEPFEEKTDDHRQKRSAEDDKKYFKIKAFGEELPLQLILNQKLMSPDFKVEIKRRDGRTEYQPAPKNTFYLGKVMSESESMVAVSHSQGMVRVIIFFHTILLNKFGTVKLRMT